MILIDFSPLVISAVSVVTNAKPIYDDGSPFPLSVDEGLIRHVSLNMLRSYNKKFGKEYGELVICCDDRHTWRKDIFPYYKANRKKVREDSPMDWSNIYTWMNLIEDELDEHFPYRVIKVPNAEADDIIGTMVRNRQEDLMGNPEKVLIISGDEDFVQLQSWGNVEQYFPLKKKIIVNPDPKGFLLEHIICGDAVDGIPNILNSDNAIVDKLTKVKMTKGRLSKLIENYSSFQTTIATEETDRFVRNMKLIDLIHTPMEIQRSIVAMYCSQSGKDKKKIQKYLMMYKLKELMSGMGDF